MEIKSSEGAPNIMLDKLMILKDKLSGRFEALGPREVAGVLRLAAQAALMATNKDRHRKLFKAALEDLKALAEEGTEEDTEEVDGSGHPTHHIITASAEKQRSQLFCEYFCHIQC